MYHSICTIAAQRHRLIQSNIQRERIHGEQLEEEFQQEDYKVGPVPFHSSNFELNRVSVSWKVSLNVRSNSNK